jgi:hypothetical protein
MDAHTLYDDGEWTAPGWLNDGTATRIQQRNYQDSGIRMPIDEPIADLPTSSWDRRSPVLNAEGLAVADLQDAFESTEPQQPSYQNESEASEDHLTEEPDVEQPTPGDSASGGDGTGSSTIPQTELLDRSDTIESTIENLQARSTVEETVKTEIESIETRLGAIETAIDELPKKLADDEPPTVTATVLRQNDLVLFRVDSNDLDEIEERIPHESEIELDLLINDTN